MLRMSGYDKALFELRSWTEELSQAVQEILAEAVQTLENEIEEDWRLKDRQIDRMRDRIVNRSLDIMSLQQLRTVELRWILGFHRIAQELERVGDYACDVAELSQLKPEHSWPSEILEMGRHLLSMCNFVVEILKPDAKITIDLTDRDDLLDEVYASIKHKLLKDPNGNRGELGLALLMARTLERTGDHIVNVAETLLFVQTGQRRLTTQPSAE